jgi:hypothetical protein
VKRYEQSIRVITTFFAALLGLGLKNLLDPKFSPENARVPCFVMSVFLFLRFLLGSNNHLWFEFVKPDLTPSEPHIAFRGRILNDFAFLIVFGLIGVAICYSSNVDEFLKRNLVLTAVGFLWVFVYAGLGRSPKWQSKGDWSHWRWVNVIQFLSVAAIMFCPLAYSWSLYALAGIYFVVLGWDFWRQLDNLERNP